MANTLKSTTVMYFVSKSEEHQHSILSINLTEAGTMDVGSAKYHQLDEDEAVKAMLLL